MRFTSKASILALLLGILTAGAAAEVKTQFPGESADMAEQRQQARERTRRIIYNDDGCGPIWHDKEGSLTPERFLYGPESRASAVLGTQVDSMFLGSGATHVLIHLSPIAETYADTEERYGPFGEGFDHFRNNIRALEALGTDALQLTVDFCKENQIEIFYSYRVNDLHLAQDDVNVEQSTWWREHPEYWLGTEKDAEIANTYAGTHPRYWGWAALNFELPEVRAYLLSILEDVANRYDIDGLEIDYLRAPLFFASNLDSKPATAEQLDILTDFQRQVRMIAVRAGEKRGRPMLVSARVPTTVARCNYIGIDIERWLKEDLLDVMPVGGGYVTFSTPAREMVELGHQYGVPVYPVISASGMKGPYNAIEGWRGAASNVRSTGADGIYLFNHCPNQPTPQFKELGDLKSLATLNKIFAVENDPSGYWGHYLCLIDSSAANNDPNSFGANMGVVPKSRLLPLTLDGAGEWTDVILQIGDDIEAASKSRLLERTVLKLQFSHPGAATGIEVNLNGKLLTPAKGNVNDGYLNFFPATSAYQVGENKLSIRFTKPLKSNIQVNLVAAEVHVTYKN